MTFMLCESAVFAQNLVTENYPPFTTVDSTSGSITGLSVDIVLELMRRSREPFILTAYPWPRSFLMAKMKSGTCVFSTARTPLREPLFKWVGPLATNNFVIFGRSDNIDNPVSLDGLRGKIIGTKADDASSEYLTTRGYLIDTVSADSENPHKLMHGRFDYWATSEIVGTEIVRQQGLTKKNRATFFIHPDGNVPCLQSIYGAKQNRPLEPNLEGYGNRWYQPSDPEKIFANKIR